jgi:molybdate transport system substrate-binding protein
MPPRPPSSPAPGLRRRACLALAAGWLGVTRATASTPIRVAAASDLKFVLGSLLETFQQISGLPVQVSFGSSGNFARQIQQGLPVDLFLSADESWVTQLVNAGLSRRLPDGQADPGALYGRGRLALYVPNGSPLALDEDLRGLQAGWQHVQRFAIAHPEHAPYGRAAREALQQLGLWEKVKPKLVLGDNIAQATQFIATGAAQAGITALSLALAPEVARLGRHVALPERLHAPLRQRMVLTRHAPAGAVRLHDYLQSAPARAVFARYGFVV